jgi:PadR family transcriptional regulator, regulatory protein PadR
MFAPCHRITTSRLTATLYNNILALMESTFFDNWTTQLRKGILELGVLAALRGRRLYGYEIVKRLGDIPGLVIGEGTVYPILSRFKREGLVTTTLVESNEGPARKYYELTPVGRRELARMRANWRAVRDGIDSLSPEDAS